MTQTEKEKQAIAKIIKDVITVTKGHFDESTLAYKATESIFSVIRKQSEPIEQMERERGITITKVPESITPIGAPITAEYSGSICNQSEYNGRPLYMIPDDMKPGVLMCNQSESIGQTDEDLIYSIFEQIDSHKWVSTNKGMLLATEIASLLPSSRCQEIDVNNSFKANRFIQALMDNGFKLSSEDQIKIEKLYVSVI